jgi:hypothetical protein
LGKSTFGGDCPLKVGVAYLIKYSTFGTVLSNVTLKNVDPLSSNAPTWGWDSMSLQIASKSARTLVHCTLRATPLVQMIINILVKDHNY